MRGRIQFPSFRKRANKTVPPSNTPTATTGSGDVTQQQSSRIQSHSTHALLGKQTLSAPSVDPSAPTVPPVAQSLAGSPVLKKQKESDPLLAGVSSTQLYHQALIQKYDASEDTLRKFTLMNYNHEQRKVLYKHYIAELDVAIEKLQNDELKQLARDVLDQVKFAHDSLLQRYEDFKVDDLQLFDVLHVTAKLISTSPLNQDNTLNDDFILITEKFSGVMGGIRSDGQSKALKCAGYALLTGLVLLAGIMIGVLTFGAFAVTALTVSVITFGIINMSGQFGFGIYTGMKSVGLFNQAYRETKIANRMEALGAAVSAAAPQDDALPLEIVL